MALETRGLSADEVIRIIERAAQSGARELTFGGLHIKFGRPAEAPGEFTRPMQQIPGEPALVDLTAAQHRQISKESLEAAQARLREEQLSLALIEDPERFEELLRDGELSDDMDSSDEDD